MHPGRAVSYRVELTKQLRSSSASPISFQLPLHLTGGGSLGTNTSSTNL